MGIANLLFLSLLTPHRIPIIPPLVARPHLPVHAGYRTLSDVFDLERWARSINKEMVEWKDVKDLRALAGKTALDGSPQADTLDQIGCWSTWATGNLEDQKPFYNAYVPDHINIGQSRGQIIPASANNILRHVSYTGSTRGAIISTRQGLRLAHVLQRTCNALARYCGISKPTYQLASSQAISKFPEQGSSLTRLASRLL